MSNKDVLQEYANNCKEDLSKDSRIKKVEISDYKGKSLNVFFDKKYENLDNNLGKFISKVMNENKHILEKKYKTTFYWYDKVFSNSSILLVLDSDYMYDKNHSTIRESIESINEYCDTLIKAKRYDIIEESKIYRDDIKEIINNNSGEKTKGGRTCVDKNTVMKFINELNRYANNKLAFSKITHITGDYNLYVQSFAFIKNHTLISFVVYYDNQRIKLHSNFLARYYIERDISKYDFDEELIFYLYKFLLYESYKYMDQYIRISSKKITINSYSFKLNELLNQVVQKYSNKYNFEFKKNGFYLTITKK